MARVIDLVEAGVSNAFLESAAGLIAGQVTSPPYPVLRTAHAFLKYSGSG